MGAVDSPNLYAFVGWAPHMGTDPMGLAVVQAKNGSCVISSEEKNKPITVYTSEQILADFGGFERDLIEGGLSDQEARNIAARETAKMSKELLRTPGESVALAHHEQAHHPRIPGGNTFCNVATRHSAGLKLGGDPPAPCPASGHEYEITDSAAEAHYRKTGDNPNLLGSSMGDSGAANTIYANATGEFPVPRASDQRSLGSFVEVRPYEAQELANEGAWVIGIQHNTTNDGHVARVIPTTERSLEAGINRAAALGIARPYMALGPIIGNVGAINADLPATHAFGNVASPNYSRVHYYTTQEQLAAVEARRRYQPTIED